MSERTYAPRSGGRTAEQRSTSADARRRTPIGTEDDARGARRQPERARTTPERARTTPERARTAPERARTAPERARTTPERDSGRAATARTARERDTRGSAPRRTPAGGGRTAPVQGTAALKLDTAVAEPLRATAATAPQLRVAPPPPISAPRAPFVALMIGLVVAGVLGILLINTKTNENAFEIDTLRDQQAVLDNQQQELDKQLAVYNSAGNLHAAAKRQGLVKADDPAYIRLPDGRVIGVPKPATGRPAVTAQDDEGTAATPQGAATAPAAGARPDPATGTGTGTQRGAAPGAGQ
jgi:hypothetical protein